MRIGIDISQIIYQGTGVAKYTKNLVESLLKVDKKNEYVLFFASLRRKIETSDFKIQNCHSKCKIKKFRIPPTLLDILWNRLHICPIEWFIGEVDVFFSSDWIQPPAKKAKLLTVVHDLTPWKYPETLSSKIVAVHKRRMKWVKKECAMIICDSEATKKDVMEILEISEKKLKVIYPGGGC